MPLCSVCQNNVAAMHAARGVSIQHTALAAANLILGLAHVPCYSRRRRSKGAHIQVLDPRNVTAVFSTGHWFGHSDTRRHCSYTGATWSSI